MLQLSGFSSTQHKIDDVKNDVVKRLSLLLIIIIIMLLNWIILIVEYKNIINRVGWCAFKNEWIICHNRRIQEGGETCSNYWYKLIQSWNKFEPFWNRYFILLRNLCGTDVIIHYFSTFSEFFFIDVFYCIRREICSGVCKKFEQKKIFRKFNGMKKKISRIDKKPNNLKRKMKI